MDLEPIRQPFEQAYDADPFAALTVLRALLRRQIELREATRRLASIAAGAASPSPQPESVKVTGAS